MTKFIKSLALFLVLGTILTSCTASLIEDPDEDEIPSSIEATYTGILSYSSSTGDKKENDSGTATISKNGSTYTISFSDGVPSLSGLKFKDNNGSYATIGTSGSLSGINIDGDKLEMSASKDGNSWAFNGEK